MATQITEWPSAGMQPWQQLAVQAVQLGLLLQGVFSATVRCKIIDSEALQSSQTKASYFVSILYDCDEVV